MRLELTSSPVTGEYFNPIKLHSLYLVRRVGVEPTESQ